jgi:hypothetical protein
MKTIEQYIHGKGNLMELLRLAACQIPLSEAEFLCCCDANNSTTWELDVFELFGLNVADSGPDGLAEEWSVNLHDLAKKLDALPGIQKCALLAAKDGFFGQTQPLPA